MSFWMGWASTVRVLVVGVLLAACGGDEQIDATVTDPAPVGRMDAGLADAGRVDANPMDARLADAGPVDADRLDAGLADADRVDAVHPDADPSRLPTAGQPSSSAGSVAMVSGGMRAGATAPDHAGEAAGGHAVAGTAMADTIVDAGVGPLDAAVPSSGGEAMVTVSDAARGDAAILDAATMNTMMAPGADGFIPVSADAGLDGAMADADIIIDTGGREASDADASRPDADHGGTAVDAMSVAGGSSGDGPLSTCDDDVQNGQETDIDCGPGCAPCEAGARCLDVVDCLSGVCQDGVCQAPTCDDEVANGDEVGLDCGGGCQACPAGTRCGHDTDCLSQVCVNQVCAPPACDDRQLNGGESDVDCGGPCPLCDAGQACRQSMDCQSSVCRENRCQAATCEDGFRNGDESDDDCGGACSPCETGESCRNPADCRSARCEAGVCPAARCDDSVRNGDETDLDCGGACPPCSPSQRCTVAVDCQDGVCVDGRCVAPRCDDDVRNGNETDLDCGSDCSSCDAGRGCAVANDCKSRICGPDGRCVVPTCDDNVSNGDETDEDCGGGDCPPCAAAQGCIVNRDCGSNLCDQGRCRQAACGDDIRNGDESDTDCGGPACARCLAGRRCQTEADCLSQVCVGELCAAAQCDDGVRNQDESDDDCGGLICSKCSPGSACQTGDDCLSAVCTNGFCAVPACDDNVRNGGEIDVDCGGGCTRCATGQMCEDSADCLSGVCDAERCQPPSCMDSVKNGAETDMDCGGDCGGCFDGQVCERDTDCGSRVCADQDGQRVCLAPTCSDGVRNGFEREADCGGVCPSCACTDDAVVVFNAPGQLDGVTTGKANYEDARCGTSGDAPEVVHAVSVPRRGVYCATTIGSTFDTILYVRSDCSEQDSEIACNDALNYPSEQTSQVEFVADPGAPLFVFVDGYSGLHGDAEQTSGQYRLNISEGRCDQQPLCQGDFDCQLGFECGLDGLCVEAAIPCMRFEDCPPEYFCDGQVCVRAGGGCSDDVECGPISRCSDGECKAPPPTGSCAPEAVKNLVVGQAYMGTTTGAPATNADEACAGSTRLSPEVVHVFRADVPGAHCATVSGDGFTPAAYVRSGCQQPFGGGCATGEQHLSFFAGAGTETFLFVDGLDQDEQPSSGTYTLTVVEGPCPECATTPDCGAGTVCNDGRCTPAPEAGSVLISEIQVAASGPSEHRVQWVEMVSMAANPLHLTGCVLEQGTQSQALDAVILPPGGTIVLASPQHDLPGEGIVDGELGLMIGLDGALNVRCNDVMVATVSLDAPRFQVFPEGAFGLSRDLIGEGFIAEPEAWCPMSQPTPGQPNGLCNRCASIGCPPAPPVRCDSDFIVRPSMRCTPVEGQLAPECTVEDNRAPCANDGVCRANVCRRQPLAGDVVMTELLVKPMARPEIVGEWIEVFNRTDDAIELDRCFLVDGTIENRLADVRIEPQSYAVFGRSADEQKNGGVAMVGTFTFALSNQGDTVALRCGETIIDEVDYGALDALNAQPGASMALNPNRLAVGDAGDGPIWCNGTRRFGGAAGDFGTPGLPNDPCGVCNPNPCANPPPAICDGLDVRDYGGPGTCREADGAAECVYPDTLLACPADMVCLGGQCIADERGCMLDGCPPGQVCDRGSAVCQAGPAAGTCLAPTPIEWDPRETESIRLVGTTHGAGSTIAGASCGGGGSGPESVFAYTARDDGPICVSTQDRTTGFDTVLHVRTSCNDPASEIQPPMGLGCADDIGDWDDDGACDLNDTLCSPASEMTVRLDAGETIYVVVDSDDGTDAGAFALYLTDGPCLNAPLPDQCFLDDQCAMDEICFEGVCEIAPAPNAACEADAIVSLVGPGTYEGSTVGQPFDQSTTECGETHEASEVVHRYRAGGNTPVCVIAEGLDFDPVVSVRRGVCTGNEEACNDDVAPGFDTTARIEFFAVAGSDYYIIVDAPNTALARSGNYRLTLFEGACADVPGPCAETDDCPGTCDDPIVVDAFGEYEFNTARAARGIDQAECAPVIGPEAVLELNLSYFGPVCVNTSGSDPGYDLVLHTRALCEDPNRAGQCLDRDDDGPERLEMDLDFDEVAYLFVDSWGLGGGQVSLSILPGNCPICDLDRECANGRQCVDGVCVQCVQDNDCDDGLICEQGGCRFPPCADDSTCGAGLICTEQRCVPGARSSCDVRSVLALQGLGTVNGATTGLLADLTAGCADTSASPEQVFRLRLPEDQTVCVETTGSTFDTVAYVRTDCARDQQEPCNDNPLGGATQTSSFTLNALANLDYFIVVDGKDGDDGLPTAGPYTLKVSAGPCPDCANDGECGPGRVCVAARCVECRGDAECDSGQQCESNRCVDLPDACDDSTPCRAYNRTTGVLGQDCDVSLGDGTQGLCVDRGMCRQPLPYQIGQRVEGDNRGREPIYLATCGGRGTGAEVIYAFEAPADGVACFTIISADYDVVLSLKDVCATNPAVSQIGFLECADVASVEVEANWNDRLAYGLTAGEIYYLVVDANGLESVGDFTLFSHYGQCGAVPPPVCQTDNDCRLGETCTLDRQCLARVGTCDDPVPVTGFGTYGVSLATAANAHDSSNEVCEPCVNPVVGRCGEAVYRFEPQQTGPVCMTTEGSSFDTVLYVRTTECAGGADQCNDDVVGGTPWSALTLNAVLGETYYIFADAWGRSGRLSLNIIDGACP
ncbi:MAG: hypothetical protein VX589_19570 [Myxococcota bacterium]|nr:hypothetical protein [Myxococcota bacterium]